MFFRPYFKSVHVHIDRPEQLAVNHRWLHLLERSVQLTVDNKKSKSWSALITKDKTADSEAMHFYSHGIWQERLLLWLDDNPVDVPRRSALGGHRRLFT